MGNAENAAVQKAIRKGIHGLFINLSQFVEKEMELERVTTVAVLTMKSGLNSNNLIFQKIAQVCLRQQKADGGWVNVEDSLWNVAFLKAYRSNPDEYYRGLDWLRHQQLEGGGWGRSNRDRGRIPITGTLLFLLPELSSPKNLVWIENAWKKDFASIPKLTYKASFFLMAMRSHHSAKKELLVKTVKWLASQQNSDFGWGPWREHPVGSSSFCTGVALAGLLHYPEVIERNVIDSGLKWIEENQLENGLWPDHYIEVGSAWSFHALTEGYKYLKTQQ